VSEFERDCAAKRDRYPLYLGWRRIGTQMCFVDLRSGQVHERLDAGEVYELGIAGARRLHE
jgi:hypothetical protein